MAESARQYLRDELERYGLQSLADWAWERYLETGDSIQVMIELRDRPEFHQRFPAYKQLADEGRAISPDEYITYEQQAFQLAQQYGVPDGMFGSSDITRLLVGNVSATELSERLNINARAALTAPQEVRDYMYENYGLDEGGLLAYYLDPDKSLPKLEQRYVAAEIGGAAAERQFALQREEAERLASQGYGYEDARRAAEAAATTRGLAGEQGLRESDLFTARPGDTAAQQRLFRAVSSRQARFSGGGGGSSEQAGVTGLGAASTA